jgi:DUF4097 and DUF4098 domain-containing protein YvlB
MRILASIWSALENIPEVIALAISDSCKTSDKSSDIEEILEFPAKNKIEFKGISGDLILLGKNSDTIEVEKDGFVKVKEKGDVLEIKALSGDMKITAPHYTDFVIKGVSGDMDISHLTGTIDIQSVSGDITGKELSGKFFGDFVSGDIDLEYEKVETIEIKSKTSDIILRLDKKTEAELDIETKKGTIDCAFELKNEEKEELKLKGIINKAKARIVISSEYGDIAVKKR